MRRLSSYRAIRHVALRRVDYYAIDGWSASIGFVPSAAVALRDILQGGKAR